MAQWIGRCSNSMSKASLPRPCVRAMLSSSTTYQPQKGAVARKILKDIGACFLLLPRYRPDINPIEMAFSKLLALIRKAAACTYDELWKAVGTVCSLFTPDECYNFFKAAGYETD